MNNIQSKYYRSGVTGVNYLIINRSVYTHSELLPDNTIRVIKCNIEEKEMNVIEKKKNDEEWKELDSNHIQHGVVIDLNDLGDRWEGSCVNGSTYGFGYLYNSDNRIIYSGFMYNGMKVCYGSEFYGGEGIVKKGVENTIDNVSRIAREGMRETDRTIIDIMTSCGC